MLSYGLVILFIQTSIAKVMSLMLSAVWITYATTCPKAHVKMANPEIFFANGTKHLRNAGLPKMIKATFVVNLIQEPQLVMTS